MAEIIGWVGTALIMTAYFLVSGEKINPKSDKYAFMNLLGAVFIGVNVFVNHAWPVLALQFAWGLVAVNVLYKNHFNDSKTPHDKA